MWGRKEIGICRIDKLLRWISGAIDLWICGIINSGGYKAASSRGQ
jgi:hypothetical protein